MALELVQHQKKKIIEGMQSLLQCLSSRYSKQSTRNTFHRGYV